MVKSESDIIDTIHTGQVITDENGTQYFVCGRNRIKISEHFAAGGRPLERPQKILCNRHPATV